MNWKRLVTAAAIGAVVLVPACNDGGDDETTPNDNPEATATTASDATSTAEPDATADSGRTGVPEVDAVVAALSSGDPEALRPLIRFSEQPCGPGLPALPCRPGEAEGTVVKAFTVATCEGDSYRPDEIDVVLGYLSPQRLFAVYRVTPDAIGYEGAEYAVITRVDANGSRTGGVVWIGDRGIVGLNSSCPPQAPEQYIETLGLTDAVLPPQE